MKVIFYCLLLLFISKATVAQTLNTAKLFDLASGAEIVTYGSISKVEDKYYYFDCFLSRGKISTLKVLKYVGRPNAYRFAKYEVGQQLFVFLKRVNGEYQLYSQGIESEVPILHDSLVIDMNCFVLKSITSMVPKASTPEYKKLHTFTIGSKTVFGMRFAPRYLYESIQAFNNCYQVLLKKPNTYPSFSCFNFFNRLTREKTNVFKNKSKLMQLMFIDMEDTQLRNCK